MFKHWVHISDHYHEWYQESAILQRKWIRKLYLVIVYLEQLLSSILHVYVNIGAHVNRNCPQCYTCSDSFLLSLKVTANMENCWDPRCSHIEHSKICETSKVRYFRGRVSNFDQSEAMKQCFLASDWLKFVTLPQKYRTL